MMRVSLILAGGLALAGCEENRTNTWVCAGNPSIYVLPEDDSVNLRFADGTAVELPRVPSASGTRYAAGEIDWFAKGDEGRLTRNGKTILCLHPG